MIIAFFELFRIAFAACCYCWHQERIFYSFQILTITECKKTQHFHSAIYYHVIRAPLLYSGTAKSADLIWFWNFIIPSTIIIEKACDSNDYDVN